MYKERQTHGDDTPVKCYYTDRQGVPMPIDTTGKEGKIKYTNNSNFFVLGPSGSGKSFFMNTVVRQYYEQNTDVVICAAISVEHISLIARKSPSP